MGSAGLGALLPAGAAAPAHSLPLPDDHRTRSGTPWAPGPYSYSAPHLTTLHAPSDTQGPARPAAPSTGACAAAARALQWLLAAVMVCMLATPARADALTEARGLSAQGDLPAALRRIDQALAAEPRDVQLRFVRGVLLMDLQRDAEALLHFQQMTLEFPELPDPYNNLALLHARAQRLDDARVALETALRNDPSHRTARANLGQLYLMLAARTLETLAAQGPMEPQQQRLLQAVRNLMRQEFKPPAPG